MGDSSFLQLLLDAADVGDFDAPLAAARSRGEEPGRLAELERERTRALRLREVLIGHRRNEAELQLLNDTANDLAALHEPDAVLQAISDRARRLLDCDLAYIGLGDEDRGDSYVKAASGNVSGLLRGLRLPRGTGVGGMVARTGEPYGVLCYAETPTIVHTPEIDGTVAAEGMRSLLGVPVKLRQRVIGVLMAAHRSTRTFGARDVSVLAMLAAHAAVAIENARLLAEAQAAVADLRVANDTNRTHADDLERTAEVHGRLTRLVLHGKGVDHVVEAVADSLERGVALLDEDGALVTASGDARVSHAEDLAAAGRQARESGRTVVRDDLCAVPMITESEFLGTVVSTGAADLGDTGRRTLEGAALVASLVLVSRRRMAEVEARTRGELLEDLLTTAPREHDLLRHRASLLGVDLDVPHVVVAARIDEDRRSRVHSAATALARRSGGLATCRKDEVVLLVPGSDAGRTAADVVRELTRAGSRPVTAGGAGASDSSSIPDAYGEAATCLRALLALGRVGEATDATALGSVGILFAAKADIGSFIHSVLGTLIDYDEIRGTDLVRTLDAFCATGQSVTNTAQALLLHVNTVAQRLARIGQLLGESWREPERLLEIQIALRLLRVGERQERHPDPTGVHAR
ncbi:GAF domain-containing protein [Actinosynnema sp. NPDC050801]|uniref:helix-turn-helix domain-containing protein n=1 Tax=unclassified Actinosynnema TaxID=2637065 RepID=UPI0033E8568C